MIFFPTLLSGPIDRSRRFEEDIRRTIPREEYLEMAGNGLLKILLGMVYKLAIASVFYLLMKKFGMDRTLISAAIYMYTYGFYLFFDFAGYSLMAVGTGYLLGVKVPDNFNKPFLSKDIQEFWNRWHITLSHWLRDYVFSRITMDLIRSGKVKDKLTIASIALMINMLIMGCWHGLTGYYILYGLYHGVLLVLFEIIRKKSAFYKKHKKDKWFILVMIEELCGDEIVREDPDIDLLEEGLIDSLDYIELLLKIEDEFGLKMSPSELTREEMATPNRIIAVVEKRLA